MVSTTKICHICNRTYRLSVAVDYKGCPVCEQPLCQSCCINGVCPLHLVLVNESDKIREKLKRNYYLQKIHRILYVFIWLGFFVVLNGFEEQIHFGANPLLLVGIIFGSLFLLSWVIDLDYLKWFRETKRLFTFT